MHPIPDITFVGGGITSLLSARLFALAGAKVTIIEKGQVGQESSWAGGGILLPLYPWRQADAISQLVLPSITAYPELVQTLIESTGLDPEYTVSGLLMTQLADLDKATSWCEKYAINYNFASPEQRSTFSSCNGQSLYLDSIAQVRNPRLLKSLKQDLLQRGVNIVENCTIEKAQISNHRIAAIACESETFTVNTVVITAGAWTGNLCRQLFGDRENARVEVFPVKGQMLILDAPVNTLQTMVLDNNQYLIPRRDGKILCGSTVEYAEFNKSTSQQAQQSLAGFARNLFPALESAPIIHHWAGIRPGTLQGIPYIGMHPEINNLAINAGHFRNGFAMGPAAAQLLYDIITRQATTMDAGLYEFSAKH
ncbi:glycine oxidase [Bathymodiolus japonicus methanotrophic gill symbiont]|uniref:NAD(P)/FAD-dependent oxidoreductase n=1 Tax=Bathymodiolus japonicus methanotrophic gill symbiont TaxID=113269 RepID=UPI001B4A636A|nr:FAD-dependent oxidoreductase [Bathymodiolus japonicus methanotrophic gill symbiont]GFO71862.1 glycine oxidase [Bathymodiolus japonicus methanotrophic gill symbiont]